MSEKYQDLVITEGIEKGVGDSIYTGFQEIRNLSLNQDGSIQLNLKLRQASFTPFSGMTFTADPSTNLITHSSDRDPANGLVINEGRAVIFSSTGTLPSPLVAGTVYWLNYNTDGTSYVCSSFGNWRGNINIDITNTGTGIHTMTSVNIGTVRQILPTDTYIFAHDSNGRVWVLDNNYGFPVLLSDKNGVLPPTTEAWGNGLVLYKNYLFIFRSRYIDVIGKINDSPTNWVLTTGWKMMLSNSAAFSDMHYSIVGQDDKIYYTDYTHAFSTDSNPGYIGSISEVAGKIFDPSDSSTYIFNNNALDFPNGYQPTSIVELGKYLMIGTNKGLYPWDRISDSFELPLLYGQRIQAQAVRGNTNYVFVGGMASIYATNISSVVLLKEIPKQFLYNRLIGVFNITPFGCGFKNNKLFFGIYSGPYGTTNAVGLWSYDIEKNILKLENSDYAPYCFSSYTDTNYFVGYNSGVGFTFVMKYWTYTNYDGYFITPFYQVGSVLQKRTFERLEVVLSKPFKLGQGIQIYYRTSISDDWTFLKNNRLHNIN